MASSGFPATRPYFTMTLEIGAPLLVGSISRGNPVTVVPITGGTLRSEPDTELGLDANFVGTGNDYIHNDAGGQHMRLDAHAVVRDQRDIVRLPVFFDHPQPDSRQLIYLKYYGVIDITPALKAILGGSMEATSTEFGNQFIHIQFECGSERYRELETGVFVGSGRFLVDRERFRVGVEYKISKITSSPAPAAVTQPI